MRLHYQHENPVDISWQDNALGPPGRAPLAGPPPAAGIGACEEADASAVSKDSTPVSALHPHSVLGFTALWEQQAIRKGDAGAGRTQALSPPGSTEGMLGQREAVAGIC